jgi:2-(1,2-epoxy-1,2-dihydrophenyl)acetyl-CoA isomerase
MSYDTIQFTEEDGAFRLTLDRPERLNSFTAQMHEEIADALDQIERAKAPRALLVTGAGRGFCAGQDLAERDTRAGDVDLTRGPQLYYNPLIRRMTSLPIPTLCAVNGVAAGAGVGLALSCDVVLATGSAKFVQAFSKIGMSPDTGTSWIVPRLIGQARALGSAMLGETLDAQQAADWGLIWECVPDERFRGVVEETFQRLARGPTLGLVATKQAIRGGWTKTLDAALDDERDLLGPLGGSHDYKEGVAAFKEKRPPRFAGR